MKRHARVLALALAACTVALVCLVGWIAWVNVGGEAPADATAAPPTATPALIARGAYLARAGNCIGCHTAPGGAALAGGRGIETPFGTVYSSNLTPDAQTGLGNWSSDAFWRALHHGRSRDGRLLYPAFPYPSFTRLTREDADALHAFLRSVAPVAQPNRPHALRFPFGTQVALAVWRALYFRPTASETRPDRTAAWNRGRYLVEGLGHCAACHASRDALGGSGRQPDWAGSPMPDGRWYAPSLADPREAGLQGGSRDEAVRLLKTGVAAHASVAGPMAEVVYRSTQHLTDDDVDAMVQYLAALPPARAVAPPEREADPGLRSRGAKVYERHCAGCHGDQGEGVSGIYPALAGNRAVTLAWPHNAVQMIRRGGFAPATEGNPRPFGMPPFGQLLTPDEVAAVATYIRQSWGNGAGAVTALDVLRIR